MTTFSSRAVPPLGPSEVARLVSDSGVAVHIVEDRSVDPVEIRIYSEASDGSETKELYSSTSSRMTVLDLVNVIEGLGYSADYQKII